MLLKPSLLLPIIRTPAASLFKPMLPIIRAHALVSLEINLNPPKIPGDFRAENDESRERFTVGSCACRSCCRLADIHNSVHAVLFVTKEGKR